ncbi:MAG: DNA translocase FtsK [Firmicutes bacterium]|nr:DNA translocase FtsK [Bacillota bacterium]
MAGVVLVALGLLGYFSLAFPHSGVLGRDLGRGLVFVFGKMAWLLPLAILASGILRIYARPRLSREPRAWGAGLVYIGLLLWLGFGGQPWGGWLGLHFLSWLALALGRPGSAIFATLLLVLGGMLLTGGSVRDGARIALAGVGRLGRGSLRAGRLIGRYARDWLYPPEEAPARAATGHPKPARRPTPKLPERPAVVGFREETPSSEESRQEMSSPPRSQPPTISHGPNPYLPPPLSLLAAPSSSRTSLRGPSAEERGQVLVDALRQFGIDVKLSDVSQGPAVTRFEIVPPPGVKVSRIVNLADDIALSLAATGVRIEAPIPGKSAIGIEVPNEQIATVLLREVLESSAFLESDSPLLVALGRDIAGVPVVARLDQMPHLLVAGATGSGKSVLVNVLITSLLYRASPTVVQLLLIDPKVVELSTYNGIPHLISPVVTDPKKAAGALRWAVQEMERRYRLFAERQVRDIARYNQVSSEPLPFIVIVIDELADLMMVAPQDVEESIARLAQMARAAGLHLVVATQRPSVDVITGTIKANIPSRIAFAVSSQVDSRTILDMAGAEKLMGRGDMLYAPVGAPKPVRIQGAFVSEKETELVVKFLREHYGSEAEPAGLDFASPSEEAPVAEDRDPLFLDAVRIVVESRQASASMLQRRMRVGYTRAARLIDQMEQQHIIGPADGARPRDVYLTPEAFQRMLDNASSDSSLEI